MSETVQHTPEVSGMFLKVCVGIITAATIGIFARVSELSSNVAVTQSQVINVQDSVTKLETRVARVEVDTADNKLDIVRLRTLCERWLDKISRHSSTTTQ